MMEVRRLDGIQGRRKRTSRRGRTKMGRGGGGRPAPNHVAGEPRFVWVNPSAIDEEQNEEKRLRAGPTIRRKTRKQGKIGGASVGPVLPPPLPPPDAALLPPPFIVPGQ